MRRIPEFPVYKGKKLTFISFLIALSILSRPISSSSIDIEFTAEVITDVQPEPDQWNANESTTAQPRIHDVSVGSFGEYKFKPRYVKAEIGDRIRFSFDEGNHTVTESTFMDPCSAGGAFDTNFFHDSHQSEESNEMIVMIDSTNPRWLFCRQSVPTPHCMSGMVFAINPGSHWFAFAARARNQSTSTYQPSSGWTTARASGMSTASSSALTAIEDGTSTSSIAALPSATNPLFTWSTVTITSMITTTFSVSQ